LLGDAIGNVTAWSPSSLRKKGPGERGQGAGERVHVGEVRALAFLRHGRWVSGGADLDVFLHSLWGRSWLTTLTGFPTRIEPTSDEEAVLVVDDAGVFTRVPLHRRAETALPPRGGALYALAIRPGKPEAVFGGMIPDLRKIALSPQGDSIAWKQHAGNSIS